MPMPMTWAWALKTKRSTTGSGTFSYVDSRQYWGFPFRFVILSTITSYSDPARARSLSRDSSSHLAPPMRSCTSGDEWARMLSVCPAKNHSVTDLFHIASW
jgi:hypothetical protein